jgi:rhodanese-related sulfurtransferase
MPAAMMAADLVWDRPGRRRLPVPDMLRVFFCNGCLVWNPAGWDAAQIRKEDDMATSVKYMLEAANAVVPRVTPAQAREMIAKGNTLVVDVRDAPEVEQSGKVAGAIHVSRGMLEFRADPESPYHDKNFAKNKTLILYCASGGRSALGGKVLKDMGYDRVYNLGAFKEWLESGGAVDKPIEPGMTA